MLFDGTLLREWQAGYKAGHPVIEKATYLVT